MEIGRLESTGDREALRGIIASKLAFRRANTQGTIVDRCEYLDAVVPSPERQTEITAVTVHGNRAVVECVVTQNSKRFHNLRLFVRQGEDWKLLGWANEPASADPTPASVESGVA